MKRREWIKSLTMAAIATGTFVIGGAQASAEVAPVQTGDSLPLLRVGGSLRYDDGLKVTFLSVKSDSRCPVGAQCIWEGNAEIVLRVGVGNQASKIVRINTGTEPRVVVLSALPPGMIGIPKSYSLRIRKLTPRPQVGKVLRQSNYRLALSISVAV